MKQLVFATNNAHKVSEVVAALGGGDFSICTLEQCGIFEDIPEIEPTLEGNAQLKARFVAQRLRAMGNNAMVFADDTGLEITALDGAPGVLSARYSGGGAEQNIDLVLANMAGIEDRSAAFRTVICLIGAGGREVLFEGRVDGVILTERHGDEGFGYDPIFRPEGYALSFAEMPLQRKNFISHRGRAVASMVSHLRGNR